MPNPFAIAVTGVIVILVIGGDIHVLRHGLVDSFVERRPARYRAFQMLILNVWAVAAVAALFASR